MLGPVFNWELIRTGRRRWHWWVRIAYVGLLLLFLYATFGEVSSLTATRQNHQVLAEIGARFYRAFSVYQLLVVLALSPVYAVTSIADEKIRRTLPYLLTSRLRDDEIVLGKIALAVLRVWEILLCGLPLCAMCLLLGGVTPEYMAADFLIAMAAAFASCSLGVLVAILSRRLSEALLLVLVVQFVWYISPLIDAVVRAAGATRHVIPIWLQQTNAFMALYQGQTVGSRNLWATYSASLTAMAVFGLVCSLAAWWLLRPAWRREEQRRLPRSLLQRIRGPRAAEPVWDKPWRWRELRSRRPSAIDRVIGALVASIAIGTLIAIAVYWRQTVASIASGMSSAILPVSMIVALYGQFLYFALLALPYLTIKGATAFAEERDGGHLDLLCLTLLDQRDLVQAKAARLVRTGAWIVALPLILNLLTFAMGWSTAWALALSSLHCLAAAAFWLALGMALSLRIVKTSHALITSLVLMIAFMAAGPILGASISTPDVNIVSMSSSPMHCIFLQVAENRVEVIQSSSFTLPQLRLVSLGYTMIYALGALVCFCWSLRPVDPWQAVNAARLDESEFAQARPPVNDAATVQQPELS